jgi:hypothetical protein
MTMYNPSSKLAWSSVTSGAGTSFAATYRSPDINLRDLTDVWLAVVVGAAAGTTPTLDVSLELKDSGGNWFPAMLVIPQITAAGMASITGGMNNSAKPLVLPERGRIAIVVGGTTPSFSGVAVSLYGR